MIFLFGRACFYVTAPVIGGNWAEPEAAGLCEPRATKFETPSQGPHGHPRDTAGRSNASNYTNAAAREAFDNSADEILSPLVGIEVGAFPFFASQMSADS